jgi:hypothetical protein
MEPFLFLCPRTGLMVQGLAARADTERDDNLVQVVCHACGGRGREAFSLFTCR